MPDIEVEIIKIDTKYFTPLGIQNPVKPKPKTDGKIKIKYKISKQDAKQLSFSVYSKEDELIGFASQVKSTDKSDPVLTNHMLKEEHLEMGTHVVEWDGFDPNDKMNTSNFSRELTFRIIVSGKAGRPAEDRKRVKTKSIVSEARWVTAKIDKSMDPALGIPKNEIDVVFNMHLKDGGEKGLDCITKCKWNNLIHPNRGSGIYGKKKAYDWEKIPTNAINLANPIIKSRTHSFEDLVELVKDGVNTYWSRNGTRSVGNGISVDSQSYKVTVNAKNTKLKSPYSLDDIPLIFNTNRKWGRSGNPGWNYGGNFEVPVIKALDGGLIQQITFNIGYIKFSDGWSYKNSAKAIEDFKDTSAHELGHEILQAFANTVYSWQHKGSSFYFPQDTKPIDKSWYDIRPDFMSGTKGENYPLYPKEHDLMKYYNGFGKDSSRIVAAEEDVKGLIWLTGIKIEE